VAEPFLGEVRIMSFGYAPRGWATCDGQVMPINQNQPLYSLLGTTFGGDGNVTFALPDLRGRTPIHRGDGYQPGARGGEQAHTLGIAELPNHAHALNASQTNANAPTPANAMFGTSNNMYAAPSNLTALRPQTVANVGGSQPHENMQPYMTLSFCIALQGIFPSPN
jgi:microcystin-dependent protein